MPTAPATPESSQPSSSVPDEVGAKDQQDRSKAALENVREGYGKTPPADDSAERSPPGG